MLLSASRVPLAALAQWCRTLKHAIGAGLSPVKIFRIQARSGPAAVRALAADVGDRMEKGDSLEDALAPHRDRFPPLFLELVAVGEQSGRLEDVFDELATYYENAHRTRQEFRRMMMYPLFQLGAAVLVLALLIFVLGMIADGRREKAPDPLGIGLSGESGAITFLAIAGVLAAAVFFAYRFVADNLTYRTKLEALGLRVPAWGAALLPFTLQRFCLAFRVSHEAGMPAERCLRFGFRATANAAFLTHEEKAVGMVEKGKEMAVALGRCGAPFPEEFLASFTLAEATGQLTEVLDRVAENYREEGIRKLKYATQVTGYAVYAGVAILIIIAIFKLASIYLGAIDAA